MHRRPAKRRRLGLKACAQPGIGGWQFAESPRQRAEIQHRPTDQQRYPAATADLLDQPPRVLGKTCGRIRFARIENVDQVMRNARPHLGVRRSEEHTSELQSLMRISYAVFCL